jgi:hypothetical protein
VGESEIQGCRSRQNRSQTTPEGYRENSPAPWRWDQAMSWNKFLSYDGEFRHPQIAAPGQFPRRNSILTFFNFDIFPLLAPTPLDMSRPQTVFILPNSHIAQPKKSLSRCPIFPIQKLILESGDVCLATDSQELAQFTFALAVFFG